MLESLSAFDCPPGALRFLLLSLPVRVLLLLHFGTAASAEEDDSLSVYSAALSPPGSFRGVALVSGKGKAWTPGSLSLSPCAFLLLFSLFLSVYFCVASMLPPFVYLLAFISICFELPLCP